ncbi:UbiA family prenyltransferase [Flammeovirga sp. SubArs3]|uniref:UbiA family prenyltransferase n=1 Tax=Flammeovirga sp. SubArs3 TaxID=2995316 RepID=UPI00248C513E|nr:UbiA family prenyltransferase [Flammeovirga sp. SubArs3]
MELKNTLTLLRIPFSFYLMPIYFFALSQTMVVNWEYAISVFFILHLLIYPASNGYNSYEDKDTESIGGLEKPPESTPLLFKTTLLMDFIGLAWSYILNIEFGILVTAYVLMSRMYSSRKIRLKKYPFLGFLTVFIFQGFWTFWMVYCGVDGTNISFFKTDLPYAAIASSLMVGGAYPLSQIYQHKQDKESGDITISMILGIKGTFIFSMILFSIAGGILFYYFNTLFHGSFLVFAGCLLPVLLWFNIWMFKTWSNPEEASFRNLMRMNNISGFCMNTCYIILLIQNHTELLQL